MRVLDTVNLTQAFEMPTIEQVSKRLFSDQDCLKKCIIGTVLSVFPVVNFLVLGYLYRVFQAGKRGKDFTLPAWDDLKGLFLDGLKFLVVFLVFGVLPIGIIVVCGQILGVLGELANLPLLPVIFLVPPLVSAALYLYMVKEDFVDCFNFDALLLMMKGAASSYVVPTFAYLGLCLLLSSTLGLITLPVPIFLGGVVYFYLMGHAFHDLRQKRS